VNQLVAVRSSLSVNQVPTHLFCPVAYPSQCARAALDGLVVEYFWVFRQTGLVISTLLRSNQLMKGASGFLDPLFSVSVASACPSFQCFCT
jgi:hypothetical protein